MEETSLSPDKVRRSIVDDLDTMLELEQAIDSLGVPVILIEGEDPFGPIILFNRAAEYFFGYSRKEMKGSSIERLIPESAKARHPAYRKDFVKQPNSRLMGAGRPLKGVTSKGLEVDVIVALGSYMSARGVKVASAIVLDKALLMSEFHHSGMMLPDKTPPLKSN